LTEESTRDKLIRSVASRLNQASSTGDFSVTQEPVAQREAGELMGYLATADGVDPQVQYLLGMLHLMRMIADPQAEQDAVIAMTLLIPLYLNLPGTPDLLPAPLRNQLDEVLGSVARQADTAELTQQHAESLADLGMLLLQRRAAGGDGVAGRAAISVLRQAAGDLGADRPSRAVILCNLGYALIAPDPRPGDLTEAVTVLREAFGRTSPDDANYARCANGLGLALLAASGITEDRRMLAEAADNLRIATRSVPETEPNLPQMLSDLGFTLVAYARSAEHGQAADSGPAEEAITVLRRAADCLSAQDSRRPQVLLRYADALITIGRPEEATGLLVGNDAAFPSGSPQAQQAGPVLLRAAMIARQLERDRDPEQEALRDWLDKTSASLLENSGNVLAVLWRLIGGEADPADQSRHADLMRLVNQILATPDDLTAMPGFVAKVMETVRRRFDDLPPGERDEALAEYLKSLRERNAARTAATPAADTSSLDELLELHERLLPELAPGSREELMITNGRRLIKAARIQQTLASRNAASQPRQWRDLEPLIKEITENMPQDLARLGVAPGTIEARAAFAHAFSPYELLARLPEWIQEIRHRLAGLPPDTPEFTEARTTLAIMLFLFATVSSDEASFEEAQATARDLVTTAWPLSAVLLSGWARAQSQRLRLAALTASLPDPAGQSAHPLTRLASDQAVRSMTEHDPTGALETLEEGRSQFLSRAVNTRSELEALRGADAQLHSRLLTVLDQITAMQRTGALAGRLATPEEGAHVQELMNEGTRLVAGLKQRPGFSRFLIPSPLGLADLLPAAAGGPVITLNVNPRRCDALILHPDGLLHVPLNGLTAAGLAEQAGSFRAAVKNLLVSHPSSRQAASARSDFDAVLGWLWDALAEPVLKALGFNEPPGPSTSLPRIWWSPTGVLNSFPLHAAGHHDQPGTSVLDCAVSSYTPTLRALMLARARRARQQRDGRHQGELRRVLAVAMPDTAGYNPLTRTVEEATAAAGHGGLKLIGADACQAAVLSALPGAAVTHFACHASSAPEEPAASRLLLHDGPLPLREIAALRLDDAELAYLSACGTSRGGASLADEAIHLAAAFQLAGYTQTVGTLWEVGDTFAAAAAAEFHRILAPDMASSAPLPAASALHATMRNLRDSDRNPQDHHRDLQPWAWTALVHAGA
jgi:CHAT domain